MTVILNRRGFLMGVGATALLPPSRLWAQTASARMSLTSAGTVMFSGTQSTLSERMALSRVATGLAATAPTRAAATTSFNLIARRAALFGLGTSPLGLALSAGIGGAYALLTGGNPLDGLLDLSVGNSAVELRYAAGCADLPKRSAGASMEKGYYLGILNDVTDSSTSCVIKIRTKVSSTKASMPTEYVNDGWTGVASKNWYDGPNGSYTHSDWWIEKTLPNTGGSYRLPAGADLAATLTLGQKLKIISNPALNAMGFGVFQDAKVWQAGGFVGGGGGSGGGGGATGYWGDDVGPAIMSNKPVQGGVTGSDTWFPSNPTLGDATTIRPGSGGAVSDWTQYEYPDKPMFPDDQGFNPNATPPSGDPGTPNPGTTNPGTTNPGTGSSGPDCYPGQTNCPAKIDWGTPPAKGTDDGIAGVTPMDWFPTPFTAPSIPVSCTGWEADIAHLGHVALNPCPNLDLITPVLRPMIIVGGTVAAGRTLLDI
jgi:hypothetical protein